jgi:hypothetical protein
VSSGRGKPSSKVRSCLVSVSRETDGGVLRRLRDRREATLAAVGAIRLAQAQLHDGVLSAAAGAVVATGVLPGKLNALIRPLMSTLQRNPSAMLQSTAAASLARLLHLCTRCLRVSMLQQRASPVAPRTIR